jgi:transmembrane sensor
VSRPTPTASEIARLREASEWVQRLNESSDPSLIEGWTQWCGADPLNPPAFERMQTLWEGFAGLRGATSDSRPRPARFQPRIRPFKWAASVMLLVGAATWFALDHPQIQVFDTPLRQQRHIALADGSHLDLAPDSRATTRFTLARREVRLERGEAFFAVAHEAIRPFIVHVNGVTVTAVGTAFDVRIDPGSTEVTVSDGRVNVTPGPDEVGSGPSAAFASVHAGVGQRVRFSKASHRLSVTDVDPEVAGAWRDGILQFLGESLEDVAGEVNRYSSRKIIVAAAFQQARFTGTVSPENVDDWLKALEQIYPVEVIDRNTNGIHIQARDDHDINN